MKLITLVTLGVLFKTAYSQSPVCPYLEVAIIIDVSGSITGHPPTADFTLIMQITESIVKKINITKYDNKISLTKFSERAELTIPCNAHSTTASFLMAIENLKGDLGTFTNTEAGLKTGSESLSSDGCGERPANITNKIIIIITDGRTNQGTNNSIDGLHNLALMLRQQGVTIVTIGVGEHSFSNLLQVTGSASLIYDRTNYTSFLTSGILDTKSGCAQVFPEDCSCSLPSNVKYPKEFSKYDVIRYFNGSCYKDKLKALHANISEELQIVTTSISTLNQCKMNTKAMIVGGTSPNVTMSFEKYKNCTVNIDCTLAEIKFLLEQKMLKTNNEIQLEKMGYGDFQMTDYFDWITKAFW